MRRRPWAWAWAPLFQNETLGLLWPLLAWLGLPGRGPWGLVTEQHPPLWFVGTGPAVRAASAAGTPVVRSSLEQPDWDPSGVTWALGRHLAGHIGLPSSLDSGSLHHTTVNEWRSATLWRMFGPTPPPPLLQLKF